MILAILVYAFAGLTFAMALPLQESKGIFLFWPVLWIATFYPEDLNSVLKRERNKYGNKYKSSPRNFGGW